MNYKVSVIIPTYNRECVISRAINSVIKQTYQNWELLIVDDGSTDRTRQIIINEHLKDSRIKLFERSDDRPKGANACRNMGIEKATGDYIAFLDSDDEWYPQKIEDQVKYLAEHKTEKVLCYSKSKLLTDQGIKIKPARGIKGNEKISDYIFLKNGFIQTSSIMISSGLADELKFDESLPRHQDVDFVLRAECLGTMFLYLNKVLVKIHWEFPKNLYDTGWTPEFSELFAIQRRKMFTDKSFENFLFTKVVINTAKFGSKIQALKAMNKVDITSVKLTNIGRLIKYLLR